jgi:hypothetical protein
MESKKVKKKDIKTSEPDFKCGGKDMTYKRLMERAKELQEKRKQ